MTTIDRPMRIAAAATAVAVGLLAGGAARAADETMTTEQLTTMTCADFIGLQEVERHGALFWLDGYSSVSDGIVQVRRDWLGFPVERVVTECETTPDAQVVTVIKKQRDTFLGL